MDLQKVWLRNVNCGEGEHRYRHTSERPGYFKVCKVCGYWVSSLITKTDVVARMEWLKTKRHMWHYLADLTRLAQYEGIYSITVGKNDIMHSLAHLIRILESDDEDWAPITKKNS